MKESVFRWVVVLMLLAILICVASIKNPFTKTVPMVQIYGTVDVSPDGEFAVKIEDAGFNEPILVRIVR